MINFREIKNALLHFLFPHICSGCGSDIIDKESTLCMRCIAEMPETNFHFHQGNPVEKIFWGRLPIVHATAQYYFTKESLIQHLIHQLKYKGNKELGKQLGRLMGYDLKKCGRFQNIDILVPLPLFPSKEKKRGYNQSMILCQGIAEVTSIEIAKNVIIRTQHTETQTKKGRMERWKNMEGKFELVGSETIRGKNILLVDDVITTGATLEACGQQLIQAGATLNIATLCYSGGN
jgi:ComF family protein